MKSQSKINCFIQMIEMKIRMSLLPLVYENDLKF